MKWSHLEIHVGSGTTVSEDEFLFSVLSTYLTVTAVAISTGWGATGKWIFGRFSEEIRCVFDDIL